MTRITLNVFATTAGINGPRKYKLVHADHKDIFEDLISLVGEIQRLNLDGQSILTVPDLETETCENIVYINSPLTKHEKLKFWWWLRPSYNFAGI
jgi:hypothetical protein